jgi:hypothetical protein
VRPRGGRRRPGRILRCFSTCCAEAATATPRARAIPNGRIGRHGSGAVWGEPRTRPPCSLTPLPSHIAALYGSAACADLLLAAGADPGAVNPEDGTTPLHDAAAGGYEAILAALGAAALRRAQGSPDRGAGAAAAGAASSSAAVVAAGAAGGPAALLTALANVPDEEGESALHTAARGNHLGCCRLLLSWGADPLATSAGGSLPADEADDPAVVSLLAAAAAAAREARGAGGGQAPGHEGTIGQ